MGIRDSASTGQASASILHLSIWQRPVFLVNSRLGHFTAATSQWHSLFRSYGVNMPRYITKLLPLALEFSSHLRVSVCGTDISHIPAAFSRPHLHLLPYYNFSPLRPGLPSPGTSYLAVSATLNALMATEFLPYVHRLRLSASP